MRNSVKIWVIFVAFVTLSNKSISQLLYLQENFKGGICVDSKSYEGTEYLNADTITFLNSVPSGATIKKAMLVSWRINGYVVGLPLLPDVPLNVLFNGTPIKIDSTAVVTPYCFCTLSSPTGGGSIMIKDVTSLALNNNNTLEIPCQGCSVKGGQAVYDGFILAILYVSPSLSTTNVAFFLPVTNYSPFGMTYSLNGLNPINITKDVGVAFEINDPVDSMKIQVNSSYIGSLFGTQSMIDKNDFSKASGSFYYENNTLNGLADDTPDGTIDSSDALIKANPYFTNNAVSCNLYADLKTYTGCGNNFDAFIFAYSTPCPSRSISAPQSYTLCSGQSLQLNTSSSATSYTWFPTAGLSNSTIANPVASPTAGTYNYIVQVDSMGCRHTEHVTLSVFPSPKFDSVSVSNAICGDIRGAATIGNAHDGTPPYLYDIGGMPQNVKHYYPLNPATYTATVTDTNGCFYKGTFTVLEINPAKANFSYSPAIACVNEPVNFTNSSAGTNLQWWNFGMNDTTNVRNPVHVFADTGYYNVTLVSWHNLRQCSDTTAQIIHVQECPPDSVNIIPPNVFSPNGDDINEVWQPVIHNLGYSFSEYGLTIYDRWGLKVFESSDSKNGWDGRTTSGTSCNDGTYFYILKYKASNTKGKIKEQNLKGFLQLLR